MPLHGKSRIVAFTVGIVAGISLLTGVVMMGSGFLRDVSKETVLGEQDSSSSTQILNRLSNIIELPSDEQPTVATVTDVNLLSDQPFFSRAQNGDKVIIFESSGDVYLFRPADNRIIDIASISQLGNVPDSFPRQEYTNVDDTPESPRFTANESTHEAEMEQPAEIPQTNENPNVTIALYNGTTEPDAMRPLLIDIIANFPQANVSLQTNASSLAYAESVIVDVEGDNPIMTETIGTMLGATVGSLPQGETMPDTDILLIIGADLTDRN